MKLQIVYQLDSLGTKMVYYVKKDNSFLSVHHTKEDAETEFEKVLKMVQEPKEPEVIKEIEL